MSISTDRVQVGKPKPADDELGFGKHFTDHMFRMDYHEKTGWHDPRIVPYQPLTVDPASAVFHYGQAVFEGLKAYRTADGSVLLFRPEQNMRRLNATNRRLCIPPMDEGLALEALQALVSVDKEWVPTSPGTSLYIRPFIVALDPDLVVKPAQTYCFLIILSPVGAYYPQGMSPVDIYVETEYVRAVKGGTGAAKAAGNYAASLRAQEDAVRHGCVQVLWLDGVERRYVEEVGSMNVFFVIDGKIITPALNGSILPGITRDSVLQLLRDWGLPTEERQLSMEEVAAAHRQGRLQEAFGAGTAAVISPIGSLVWQDETLAVGDGRTGPLAQRLYDELTGIQTGRRPDPHNWTIRVI